MRYINKRKGFSIFEALCTMKTILVTGCNGQLGNELRDLENHFPAFNFLFTDRTQLDLGNLASIDAFCQSTRFNYCINAAAYTKVDMAENEKELCYAINVHGVKNLAQHCFKHNIPFIHFSSDYVFEGNGTQPYNEEDKCAPKGIYAQSKYDSELCLKELANNYPHAIYTIIRTSWVYSSHGHNFVKTMIRLMRERTSLGVVNDQVGCPTYAKDLAVISLRFINKIELKQSIQTLYHYSNEGICSWYEFAKEIAHFIEYNGELKAISTAEYPTPAPRPAYSVLDKSRIKKDLNIEIRNWEDALDECLSKLLNNEN